MVANEVALLVLSLLQSLLAPLLCGTISFLAVTREWRYLVLETSSSLAAQAAALGLLRHVRCCMQPHAGPRNHHLDPGH